MRVVSVAVPELGNRAHLVHDGQVGLVVDPPRDLARVQRAAEDAEVEIVAVADTHIHNDYLSGGLALARRTGAEYLLAADEAVEFERVGLRDGDVFSVGELTVTALWTPGHTPTHLSYLVRGPVGQAVFTGGSLLYGTVGRTDLIDPATTEELARDQWRSAHRLANLDAATALHPTHGFGSFCATGDAQALLGSVTVQSQRGLNPALVTEREEFVADLVAGFGPVPRYYEHMASLNRAGAGAHPVREPVQVTEEQVAAAAAEGVWVIDLRSRGAYAEGHVPGSVSVEYGSQFATYVGWLAPWGGRHVLLVDDPADLDAAARDLAGIGIDDLRALVVPPAMALPPQAGYRRVDWAAFQRPASGRVVLDVRRRDEFDDGHLPEAINIPVHDVELRLGEIPAGEVWVHCRSGYRAGIAASLLHRAGREVVHVDDDWEHALFLGLDRRPAA